MLEYGTTVRSRFTVINDARRVKSSSTESCRSVEIASPTIVTALSDRRPISKAPRFTMWPYRYGNVVDAVQLKFDAAAAGFE